MANLLTAEIDANDGEWFELPSNNAGTIRVKATIDRLDFTDQSLVWFGPDGFQGGLIERHFTTTATQLRFTVRFTTSIGVSPINEVCYVLDGTPSYITWDGSEGSVDGIYHVVKRTILLYQGTHNVILRDGPANAIGYPQYLSVLAKFAGVESNAEITPFGQPTPINAVVVFSDSIGQGIGSDHPTTQSYVPKLRDTYFGASISLLGGGGDGIGYHYAIDPTMATLARRIAAHCIGARSNQIFIQIGINDYIHRVALDQTSAQFGTRVGLLLDQMRLILPLADVIVASPLLMQGDAATDWRTAMATACSTRNWTRYVNGAAQTPVSAWVDGLHPTTAQYAVVYECIESILGFWAWGNLPGAITSFLPDDNRNQISNNGLLRAYDRGTEQSFVQATATGQPALKSTAINSINDGPANCPYFQTLLASSQSALATFKATRVRCTIALLIRFDGAGGTQQAVMSGQVTNTCSLVRLADNSIQYYSSGFTSISAAPPSGWHVYEISRWDTASYAWIRVDGGTEIEATGLTQSPISGIAFGRENGNALFPANASFAEFVVVPGDPSEAPDARGRLTNAVGRQRFLRHILARYGITMGS